MQVVQVGAPQQAKRPWSAGVCGGATDVGICCYVLWCPLCAAGDVASAAGRSYFVSCGLMLLLSALITPFICAIGQPIIRATDRQALAQVHNIEDPVGCCGSCLIEFLGWGMGLPFCCCLLCQELYTIKTLGLRYPPYAAQQPTIIVVQGGGQVPQQQFMYAQQPGMPPQQVAYPQQQQQGYPQAQAYPAPQGYPPQQQQGYPPQQQQGYPPQQQQGYPPQQGYPQAQVVGYDPSGKQIQ